MNAVKKSSFLTLCFLSYILFSSITPAASIAGELDYDRLPFTEKQSDEQSTELLSGMRFKGFIFSNDSKYKIFTLRCAATQGTLQVGEEGYRLIELEVKKGKEQLAGLPEGLEQKIADKEVIGTISGRIVKKDLKLSSDKVSAAGQVALGTIGKIQAVILRDGKNSVLEGGITEGDLGGPLLALAHPTSKQSLSACKKKDVILRNTLAYSEENILVEGKAPAVYDGLAE